MRLIQTGSGARRLLSDTLRLFGTGMTNSAVLYFQGTVSTSEGTGAVFGDGLRCVGGSVTRLDVEHNTLGVSSSPGQGDPPLRVPGQITAPGERVYQAWYRDAQSFCTPVTFNLTNAVRIAWRP